MPGLTVTEKNHWRDRIAARIEKAAERIRARHPALFDRVAREAHAQALASLGLAERLRRAGGDQGRGGDPGPPQEAGPAGHGRHPAGPSPIDEVADRFSVRYGSELALPHEVAEAIARRQAAHQEQLLADDPVGREIARLEAEKDNLLDTVWLAARRPRSSSSGPRSASCSATSRRPWSARRWRSSRRRRPDAEETIPTGGDAGRAGVRRIATRAATGRSRPDGLHGPRIPPALRAGSCRGWEGPRRSATSTR